MDNQSAHNDGTEMLNSPTKKIRDALAELDKELVEAEGVLLRPSQCYYFSDDPFHVLFNTNCPDDLKKKIESILSFHMP